MAHRGMPRLNQQAQRLLQAPAQAGYDTDNEERAKPEQESTLHVPIEP